MKYKKKPVIIEAVQWTGRNKDEVAKFCDESAEFTPKAGGGYDLVIHTLEGDHKAIYGDFIIRGVHGEYYPCKADIFEKTYEAVKDDGTPADVQATTPAIPEPVKPILNG